ncbi:cadmium-translocating P-type ATPase [Caldalkalibacillus thermarum TA2.A1]|uniref:P-type Cu(+) transporter n=1 Tax=Caldalkalibacillus thermarum (strain TA2.A1) TaxID=986075 RepID=A0A8X8I1J7_CALTT|nr:heavy metal translocating P-type ATPase [Caldalkalibacillus thermarum]QZT32496.1 cadmium-translocating P-type ATPase [Caldalkalibacillus thermarum TA2.A1]
MSVPLSQQKETNAASVSEVKWLSYPFFKRNGQLIAALGSGLLLVLAWLLSRVGQESVSVLLYLTAYLIGGYVQGKEGLMQLFKERKVTVNLLMVLAALGAALIGHWAEGAILIFIFALSGALETYAVNKSHKEITALMTLQPEEATLVDGDALRKVHVEQLQIGQHILVKPGERIPVDGQIVKGQTTIDESILTGESIPVEKGSGDEVFTGTMNGLGTLVVCVQKEAHDTVFQKIVKLVQDAQNKKSSGQQFIERFETIYVKVVLAVVLLMMFLPHYLFGWSWTETIYRAIVLLVVASPCAIVASISPAMLSAISNSARRGVLLKSGVHLETLANLQAICLDKTGTITQGEPVVTDVYVCDGMDIEQFLRTVGSVEQVSSHPLADAITRYVKDKGISLFQPEYVENVPGHGVKAQIEGHEWKIGKLDFVGKDKGYAFQNGIAHKLEQERKTVVYVACGEEVIGVIALKDTVREEAKHAVARFKKLGIEPVLITGDTYDTAQKIAQEVGIRHFYAQCLPEDKVRHIHRLRGTEGKQVAMVGDGINDAPALAAASVGITMGAGSDVAIETGDIVLVKNNLLQLAHTVELARRMNRIIKQNIVFSVSVIILLVLANAFQVLTLPYGVIGHEGSTLLVILNGLRLLKGTGSQGRD